MKKIFFLCSFSFLFVSPSAFSQTSVTAGPEQKIKSEMKFPAAVRPGSEFTVEIKITKGSISGLARFQQYLVKGMTATAIENDGADFSFENQNVKFIWVALPTEETLTLKYKISVDASLNSSKTLSGTFSYVENGRTKTHSIVPKELQIDPKSPEEEVAAAEPERPLEPPQGEAAPVMIDKTVDIGTPPSDESKAETPVTTEKSPESENVTAQQPVAIQDERAEEKKSPEAAVPVKKITEASKASIAPVEPTMKSTATASSTGIVFRVQIAAMNEKRFRKDGYFQEKFGITQTVYNEEHDGLKKYSVGNCSTYNEARALRDAISSNANGSFVVAYKDGARISVAEALEALKQK
jgi:hypothetical protein